MMCMTCAEIVKATGAKLVRGTPECSVQGVSTDTRTIEKGNLFVALEGESFDAHQFVADAIEKGASAVLVDETKLPASLPGDAAVLGVSDTLSAMGDLAASFRARFDFPVVGITGSNGKTSTKEMIAHVLGREGTLVWSKKSFNNYVGVPLTVFEMVPDAFAGVFEMGASGRGEIARLCSIVRPNVGVITNIGRSHLEGFGTLEGVASAKGELFDALDSDGLAIMNADDEWCLKLRGRANCEVVTFGTSDDADVRAADIRETESGVSFTTGDTVRVELSVLGKHNVYNALAAMAVCLRLGVAIEEASERLASFVGVPMRMERVEIGGVVVINDAYNANPMSMAAALDEFDRMESAGRKHFVCGDMLELGESSVELHKELGERIAARGIDRLWLFGSEVEATRTGALSGGLDERVVFITSDYEELERHFLGAVSTGDVVLLKGSRRMALERVLDALKSRPT